MTNTPGVGPSHPDHKKPVEHIKKPDHTKKFKDSSGQPPQGFAQKAWGFDAAEAKKFISTNGKRETSPKYQRNRSCRRAGEE